MTEFDQQVNYPRGYGGTLRFDEMIPGPSSRPDDLGGMPVAQLRELVATGSYDVLMANVLMASVELPLTYSPGKLEEFIKKLQSVGAPDKITTEYPKSIGFSSSHARGFPAVLKFAGLLEASGQPTEAYKKGLRGGSAGRKLVGKAIRAGVQADVRCLS